MQPFKRVVCLASLTGSLVLLPMISSAQILLTNRPNGLEPTETFACSDRVYAYVTLPTPQVGEHKLEGRWISPTGEVKEAVQKSMKLRAPGQQIVYVWLDFGEEGGLLGSVRDANENPSAHDGKWKVQVLWDGKPAATSDFEVKCL
jgi:hypothetical protein